MTLKIQEIIDKNKSCVNIQLNCIKILYKLRENKEQKRLKMWASFVT